MNISLTYAIIALGLVVPGIAWAACKPDSRACRVVRRVFFGYALGVVYMTFWPQVLVQIAPERHFVITAMVWAVGGAVAILGFSRHGLASWIDAGVFVAIAFALLQVGLTNPALVGVYSMAMLGLPLGTFMGSSLYFFWQ